MNVQEPDVRKDIKEAVLDDFPLPFPEDLRKRELVPTAEEIRTMTHCDEALIDVVRSLDLGAPDPFPIERVHFLPPTDPVWETVSEPDLNINGFNIHGHVGLKREPVAELAFKACHELGHAHSRHSFSVRETSREEKTVSYRQRHEGMQFIPDRETNARVSRFWGFNEGTVEQLARAVRTQLVKRHGSDFSEEEKRLLTEGFAYPFHLQIVLGTIVELRKHDDLSLKESWRMLVNDLLEGTYEFIKKLDRAHPGAAKILAAMGPKDDDALNAAIAMGEKYQSIAKMKFDRG